MSEFEKASRLVSWRQAAQPGSTENFDMGVKGPQSNSHQNPEKL